MIKFIEIPDLHFSPNWAEITEKVVDRQIENARKYDIDFFALPGDAHNAALMSSDKGGINAARKLFAKMLAVAPVVVVQGTLSHDAQGCYGPYTDLGLVILEPATIYGLYGKSVRVVDGNRPDALLFGVPELNKANIQATLGLPAEQANRAVEEFFRDYVASFLAPARMTYASIPAVALLHGNVSDARRENQPDIILRSSDILLRTEDMRVAQIDRWSLGHIHTPWESEVISAGYAGFTGIDGNPWGKRDFVPAANLVEIDDSKKVNITRLPYGTPERRKIFKPLESYDPAIAYWLDTEDTNLEAPDAHPWSRVTYRVDKQVTRRVTAEQAEDVRTLSDLFKLIDPMVTPDVLELVDTIPAAEASHRKPTDVSLDYLKVSGCVFFHGKTLELNLKELSGGVTAVMGANGSGKSSLLAFCSPYPIVIGKDTVSGRDSAIKDFFNQRDSMIEKRFTVNGRTHTHIITIKGAHRQNPKTECYLDIDGQPQLDTTSFDEMMTTCEHLYGPYADYLLTSFYVQPLQGKTGSGLMSASLTEVRNVVQAIAGIDREPEKRYALDRLNENEKESLRLENWVTGYRESIVDPETLKQERQLLADDLVIKSQKESELQTLIESQEQSARDSQSNYEKLKNNRDIAHKNLADREHVDSQILAKERHVQQIKANSEEAASLRAKLDANIKAQAENRKIAEIIDRNKAKERQHIEAASAIRSKIQGLEFQYEAAKDNQSRNYQRAVSEYDDERRSLINLIAGLDSKVSTANQRITALDNPCPQCGYIADDASAQIAELRQNISDDLDTKKAYELKLANLAEPQRPPALAEPADLVAERQNLADLKAPQLEDVPDPLAVLSDSEEQQLIALIDGVKDASAQIAVAESELKALRQRLAELKAEVFNFNDDDIRAAGAEAQAKADDLARTRQELREAQDDVVSTKARISGLDAQILESEERYKKMIDAEAKVIDLKGVVDKWRYISNLLMPSKIPALELDLVLDKIDRHATAILQPYYDSRFSFNTVTQQQGREDRVDRFDIMIYDAETGEERSLSRHSPGQKAFYSDAYTKALIKQRDTRALRTYRPVIMDESDGPIQPELVSVYYEMQRRYWADTPVLAVSHSPASHEHIENRVEITSLLKDIADGDSQQTELPF